MGASGGKKPERTSTSKSAAARVEVSGICSLTVEKPAGRGTASARRSRGLKAGASGVGIAGMREGTAVASSDNGCGVGSNGGESAAGSEAKERPATGMEASLMTVEEDEEAEERRTRRWWSDVDVDG